MTIALFHLQHVGGHSKDKTNGESSNEEIQSKQGKIIFSFYLVMSPFRCLGNFGHLQFNKLYKLLLVVELVHI